MLPQKILKKNISLQQEEKTRKKKHLNMQRATYNGKNMQNTLVCDISMNIEI